MAILKNQTFDYLEEYERLVNTQIFNPQELDYDIAVRHCIGLKQLAEISNCGVSVYDHYRRKHIFVSYNFADMFGYNMKEINESDSDYFAGKIHPDDYEDVQKNGTIALRYALENRSRDFKDKIVTEYRVNIFGKYIRVIEQFSVLEFDIDGNIWLSLSMLDISPNQNQFERVESRLYNCKTGEMMPLPKYEEYQESEVELTEREKEILIHIREGLLSKEIADKMLISINTVNTYRQKILKKLAANNSQEAIRVATKMGLI